jgi:hypothetical protein
MPEPILDPEFLAAEAERIEIAAQLKDALHYDPDRNESLEYMIFEVRNLSERQEEWRLAYQDELEKTNAYKQFVLQLREAIGLPVTGHRIDAELSENEDLLAAVTFLRSHLPDHHRIVTEWAEAKKRKTKEYDGARPTSWEHLLNEKL